MKHMVFSVLTLLLVPSLGLAASPLTREQAFLQVWDGIQRPVESVRQQPYSDVPKGQVAEPTLTYARSRGITIDADQFRPNDAVQLLDAAIWALRTRSVAAPEDINEMTVPAVMAQTGLANWLENDAVPDKTLQTVGLQELLNTLDTFLKNQVHEASMYGEEFHGQGTAFGETFDMNDLTAAHRTYPHNTLVKVTNVANGKSVTVRINDRGPFVKGRDLDLSVAAFTQLAPRSQGKLRATFERLGDARIVGPCRADVPILRRISRTVFLDPGVPKYLHLGQKLLFRANGSIALLAITYPDGSREDLQNWILLGEEFSLQPSMAGDYTFLIRDRLGKRRRFHTQVVTCRGSI
jgi:rare lipoprotein A